MDSSSVDSATPEQVAAIDALTNTAIPTTTNLLNSIPGGTVFHMPDGARVTIDELRALWCESRFFSVERDVNTGNGGFGVADRNGGNPIFRVDLDQTLVDYMHSPVGQAWYPLHELAHVTGAGWTYNGGGHGFSMNEAYANALALAVAAAAGSPIDGELIQILTGTQTAMGVTFTLGNGETGTISPNSRCGG